MAYDFEDTPGVPAAASERKDKVSPKDLEAIVTVMDIAALCLTTKAGDTFTFEEMFAEMNELGGPDLQFEERDVRTVLATYPMISKQGTRLSLR